MGWKKGRPNHAWELGWKFIRFSRALAYTCFRTHLSAGVCMCFIHVAFSREQYSEFACPVLHASLPAVSMRRLGKSSALAAHGDAFSGTFSCAGQANPAVVRSSRVFHLNLLQCFVYNFIMPSFPCFSSTNVSIHNIHNIVSCICTSLAFWQLFRYTMNILDTSCHQNGNINFGMVILNIPIICVKK